MIKPYLEKSAVMKPSTHIKSITNSIWIRLKMDASVVRASFECCYQVGKKI